MSPRKTTRSGKPLDKKTGKIVTPRVGTIQKGEDGKLRRVTKEDVKAARTTVLPTVGPEAPKKSTTIPGTPGVVGRGPRAVIQGAAAGTYPQIKALTSHAQVLLGRMSETHGTSDYHKHHEEFNMVHATLGQMSPHIHGILGMAKDLVHNPSDKSVAGLAAVDTALKSRLSIIKTAAEDRQKRRDANRPQGE